MAPSQAFWRWRSGDLPVCMPLHQNINDAADHEEGRRSPVLALAKCFARDEIDVR